jgi:hypothetical protein
MSLGETDLMGSDVPAERFKPMRSVYLSLAVNSIDDAERIVALLPTALRSLGRCKKPFCDSLRDATRPVRNFLDDHQRAPSATEHIAGKASLQMTKLDIARLKEGIRTRRVRRLERTFKRRQAPGKRREVKTNK